MDLPDVLHGGEQLLDDLLGVVAFDGQVEGAGGCGEYGGAVLHDAEVAHLLAGTHLGHLKSF
jgi:hypothetical protein